MFGLLGTNLFCVVILSGYLLFFLIIFKTNMPMIPVDCMLQGTDLLRYAKNHTKILTF